LLARDRALFGGGGSSDPYVRLKYKKVNTIKSKSIEKTCNPSWYAPLPTHKHEYSQSGNTKPSAATATRVL
jgi:hypothetical protein